MPIELQAQTSVKIKTILAAWRNRQDRVRSAKFEWTEQQTYTKGSLIDPRILRSRGKKSANGVPPEDITLKANYSLTIDGKKMRYSWDGKDWSGSAFVPQTYISVFDGEVAKILWPRGTSDWPIGMVRSQKKHVDADNYHLRAVLMTYRAPHSAFISKNLSVSQRRAVIDNAQGVALDQMPHSSTNPTVSLWVDPQRDFIIRRYMLARGEKVTQKVDVQYTRDDQHGWTPSSWRIVRVNPDGTLFRSYDASVTNYVINDPVADDRFRLIFPTGARVSDMKEKDENKREYLVKQDGTKRFILAHEIGATYEQMINTETGNAFAYRPLPWYVQWLVVFAALVVLATGFFLLRAYRRRVRRTQSP